MLNGHIQFKEVFVNFELKVTYKAYYVCNWSVTTNLKIQLSGMVMLILATFLLYDLKKSPTVPLRLLTHECSLNNTAFWHIEWPEVTKLTCFIT